MSAERKVIIVGSSGQDGRLLRESLEAKNCTPVCISRDSIYIDDKVLPFSIHSWGDVQGLISKLLPDEIYFLPAYHSSAERDRGATSPAEYLCFHEVHVQALLNFLDAIQKFSRKTKLFYASSSLIFDGEVGPEQNEETPFSPIGFYGLTKLQGLLITRFFRKQYGIMAYSGILYSHESLLRSDTFLSKKLIKAAYEIAKGNRSHVVIGNLDAINDWGYAPDFVEAFQMILELDEPDDFIVSTREPHTVREFAELVFKKFSLDYRAYVIEDPNLLARATKTKIGDNSKLIHKTGWRPTHSFENMIDVMVKKFKLDNF